MRPSVKQVPGKKAKIILRRFKTLNGGWSFPYPFIHSRKGDGCYFYDIDGNVFLDFGSQIASNPLGYNHHELMKTIKEHTGRSPIKYAGQDFVIKEHLDLLEELTKITPKGLNAAFFINSGAEAVENAIKICLRRRPGAKVGISFESAFHGRTLGALSLTNSKAVQKKNFFTFPIHRLPFHIEAGEKLKRIIEEEGGPDNVGFVVLEPIQGEGGYHVPEKQMVKDIRNITKKYKIPFIVDEVQAGMGRTGKWWAHEHFSISPDVMTSAKALQVGAAIARRTYFPEAGAISSTWGGGSILDLALGTAIIRIIKKERLLSHITKMGVYLREQLIELQSKAPIFNIRGFGLMQAFDVQSLQQRNNLIIECLRRGLVLLGCGKRGVRLIPPYIITEREIDQAIEIIKLSVLRCLRPSFKHKGPICQFVNCGREVS
ncbi:aminotransferase class III-fold pyridoxal phosphate-dependent enzyme [Candidatus Woesearchaeota archaeon]|nr:aminotransferase class III-fold pyridoxal phosphate-dependent enzyme [Candidatus Woesearchaeota archaeon]